MLCIKLFFSRILDVSLGTTRTILTVRGQAVWASLCGFCEVSIWFLVVREALTSSMSGTAIAFAYAAGFAAGTFIGGKISNKLIKGNLEVQIVTSLQDGSVIRAIREAGFAVSVLTVNASEFGSEKYMLIAEIENRRLTELQGIVYHADPKAFVTVRETRLVYNGFFKKK